MNRLLALVVVLSVVTAVFAQQPAAQAPVTVFKGEPSFKISEGGVERLPEPVAGDRAIHLRCVISRIGDSYYWASRENIEMGRIDSGAFTTFIALNGAGYVKVIQPDAKGAVALLMDLTERRFDYVEHLTTGLRSVTYYGTRQQHE